jgi:hypothetical protein
MGDGQQSSLAANLVGSKVLIRTVMYFLLGEVVEAVGSFVKLDGASWVADTGRLGKAIADGTLNEVEMLGDGVHVNLGAAVDIIPWNHDLPTATK